MLRRRLDDLGQRYGQYHEAATLARWDAGTFITGFESMDVLPPPPKAQTNGKNFVFEDDDFKDAHFLYFHVK